MERTPTSASPRLMRRINAALVLQAIRDAGSASRSDIRAATGLSKPTVSEVVEYLVESGYVSESRHGGAARRPGPRARVLSFRADLGHVLGIDVGANKILVLVADLSGAILASERRRTGGRADAASILAAVRAASRSALASANVPRASLLAVVVGTPGVVDRTSGRVTLAPQLADWEGIELVRELGRSFSCSILVENEVHLSVLAERWRGAAQGIDDAVYVQIGVGIGAGILIGGELYRGAGGAAGEIGYLPFPGDGHPPDGLGRFEHAAGGGAFASLGRDAAAGPDGALLRELAGGDPSAVDAEIVFAAARRGDRAARRIVERIGRRLATGIAAVSAVLNPATVIVGGGVSRAGADLIEPVERHLRGLVPTPPRLVASSLGEESVALGAVRLGLRTVEERLFSFDQAVVAPADSRKRAAAMRPAHGAVAAS